ncbi:MAG: GGDEF domain-containing protein [Clostridiales bacterium]|nr:GGDEF domain-containing protein [Clostridiales bacterium]
MKKYTHIWSDIVQGNIDVRPNQKFTALMICVCLVHLCYSFCFFYLVMPILWIYNALTVFFYILNSYMTYTEHYSFSYIGCFLEINTHAILTAFLLGWDVGFSMFCIIVVPIAFYMAFSLATFRRSIFIPTVFAILSLFIFLFCRILTYVQKPLYGHLPPFQALLLYCFNTFVTFAVLILFSLLFIFEIRNAQIRLEKQNKKLDRLANRDSLTGLLNRRSMQKYLLTAQTLALEKSAPFCLILCDIDDFKKVNDTYGHEGGDKVLIHICELLCSIVSEKGAVCRWGGEEILILLRTSLDTACEVTENMRSQIATQPTLYKEHEIHHTMTFGITEFSKEQSLDALISSADKKLYIGKRNGKNRIIT